MKLKDLLEADVNIAEKLDDELLQKIGKQVCEGYEADLGSRKDWEKSLEVWTRLALQVVDKKTYPWANASNVKYPLLATASMQFAARAYPSLVPSNGQIVKCKVVGADMDGQKTARAERISKFMSYQIMDEMEEWEEEMDRLLIVLPIVGTAFKKTYWCSVRQRNRSCLIMPKDLVVNYWARSLEDCERVTETVYLSKRKVKERQLAGLFLDTDLGEPSLSNLPEDKNAYNTKQPEQDETTPYLFLEQHMFLDLDDDGYAEPYIVVVESASQKVVRIVPRFDADDVDVDAEGNILRIEPYQYYTKYGFVPNPDGSFYDIGFGRLLGPINESVDTLINQMIDAGSMSNLQAGFIGKGLRMKMGESRFSPGEWKVVNATGDDIKKQIFPLPTRDPNPVLMNLLQFLVTAGKELASVAEIFVGKMPGQNTPATTTMASIEQGMKVFTAVYKRIFRSLTKEFRKLYHLNKEYLNPQTEVDVLDMQIPQSDFEGSENDVIPAADPAAVSAQEKIGKAQALLQLLPLGTINPMEVTKLYLEAHDVPMAERYLMQPQPQQDPEMQKMQMEAQLKQEEHQNKMQLEAAKLKLKQAEIQQKMQIEAAMAQQKIQHEAIAGQIEHQQSMQEHNTQMKMQDQQHQMSMKQADDKHSQSMQQQKEAAKNKPTEKGKPKR